VRHAFGDTGYFNCCGRITAADDDGFAFTGDSSEVETAAILNLPPEMQKMALESRITAKMAIKRAMERVIIERYFQQESDEQELAKEAQKEVNT
jgi:hypothetical protein